MNTNRKQLDYLLGGKWAMSLRGSLIALPWVILAAPLGNSVGASDFPFARWTLVSSISALPPIGLLALLSISLYRHRLIRPRPWWWILVIGGILGGIKGYLMTYVGYKWGLLTEPFSTDMEKRIGNNFLIGACLFPIITFLIAGYDRYSIQRNKLLRQALSQNTLAAAVDEATTLPDGIVDDRINARIEKDLAETRAVLQELIASGRAIDGKQIANYLRNRTSTSIRPLSHSLLDPRAQGIGAHRIRSAIKWGILNMTIFPGAIVIGYAITALPSFFKRDHFPDSIERFTFHLLVLAAILYLSELCINKFKIRKLYPKFLFTILVLIINDLVVNWIYKILQLRVDLLANRITDIVWILFLVYFVSTSITVFTREEAVIESLKSIITDEELAVAGAKVANSGASRDLARFLHTNMQTALINSANVIDRATARGDVDAIRLELAKVQELLHLPGSIDHQEPEHSLDSTLRSAKQNWDGLMKVKSSVTGTVKTTTPSETKKLAQVLDEALSNSFRHGNASQVTISLKAAKDRLILSVSDNGVGPLEGAEGMGSQTFDSIGGENWDLQAQSEGGAIFTLSMKRQSE